MAAELHCNYRTRLPQWSGAARYGSNTEMLQQIAPSRLTCRKVPKAFLFAGRANYPDNAFFDKESAQSQAKGFSFYTAKCFSFLKKRGDPQRFPLHMPLHAPPFWLFIQGHKTFFWEAMGTLFLFDVLMTTGKCLLFGEQNSDKTDRAKGTYHLYFVIFSQHSGYTFIC